MKKIKKREIIEAQKDEIAELEEIISRSRGEKQELEDQIEAQRDRINTLCKKLNKYQENGEEKSRDAKIRWFFAGLVIAIIGWLVIPSLADYCTYAFLSDADCRYENFFEPSNDDRKHLFHLEKYLKANGVRIDHTGICDEEDTTNIYVYGKKDAHGITIRGKTNWHNTVYDLTPYSDDWVPYERNTGEASLEASSNEYSFMHGVSWTLGYEWDLRDDEFIQDLDTGMLLPRKLLEDLDSVLANDKFANYSRGPFEAIENPYYKIRVNGEEVKEYVHD